MKVKILIARANVIDSSGTMFTPECLEERSGETVKIVEKFDNSKHVANALIEYESNSKALYIKEIRGLDGEDELEINSHALGICNRDGLMVITNRMTPALYGIIEDKYSDSSAVVIQGMSHNSISFVDTPNADTQIGEIHIKNDKIKQSPSRKGTDGNS